MKILIQYLYVIIKKYILIYKKNLIILENK